ncbi:hypothetical protein ACO0SA_000945 [Hanseniaspora valbyensis]
MKFYTGSNTVSGGLILSAKPTNISYNVLSPNSCKNCNSLNKNNIGNHWKNFTAKRNVQTTSQKSTLNFINNSNKKSCHDKIKEDLSKLTVKSLKQQLRSYNLKVGGKKSELVDRLANFNIDQKSNMPSNFIKKKDSVKVLLSKNVLEEIEKYSLVKKSDECEKEIKLKPTSKNNSQSNTKQKLINVKEELLPRDAVKTNKIVVSNSNLNKLKEEEKNLNKPKEEEKILNKPKEEEKISNKPKEQEKVLNKPAYKVLLKSSPINVQKIKLSNKPKEQTLIQSCEFNDLPNYTLNRRDIVFMVSFMSFSILWLLFGV